MHLWEAFLEKKFFSGTNSDDLSSAVTSVEEISQTEPVQHSFNVHDMIVLHQMNWSSNKYNFQPAKLKTKQKNLLLWDLCNLVFLTAQWFRCAASCTIKTMKMNELNCFYGQHCCYVYIYSCRVPSVSLDFHNNSWKTASRYLCQDN